MATNLLDQRIGFTADGATLDYEAFDGVPALEDADDASGLFPPALGVDIGRTVGNVATLTRGLEEQSPMGFANSYDSDGIAPLSAPPQIGDFSPAPGTSISANAALEFDIFGDAPIGLVVFYASGGRELVHDDKGFTAQFATSTATPITGGTHFTLRRVGGWPAPPSLDQYALGAVVAA